MNFSKSDSSSVPHSGAKEVVSESHMSSDSDEDFKPRKKTKKETKAKKTPEKKSYRCDRCNFSSCSKAKYTKHAKSAHSGTIVQCDHCEFKTPYKWNLDRHYKNHLGGGALCCHLCNFSCDIKQSLTVHLQNHHTNVPEEIIESVKRQQIPSRNQNNSSSNSNNNNSNNSSGSNNNSPSTNNTTPLSNTNNVVSTDSSNNSAGISSENLPGEKKVPPLRISRSLTGLALGEENNPNGGGKTEDEPELNTTTTTTTSASVVKAPVVINGSTFGNGNNDVTTTTATTSSSPSSGEHEIRTVRKCELCDFETSGIGNASSEMKKHLASQHGIHHHKKHHHRHHHNKLGYRDSSSSPEYSKSQTTSTSLPIVPIPLPPKKSKAGSGTTSPRPGQSASSTSNSPAIHRSQSPLKASEAIGSYTEGQSESHNNQAAVTPPSDHPQSILNLTQQNHQLKSSSSDEKSAFTPVQSGEYSQQQLSSLKKPKHRALAQFYQKIKPTVVEDVANDAPPFPLSFETGKSSEPIIMAEDLTEDGKSGPLGSSKSNRCQFCRQRCKSSADLVAHMEKCSQAKKENEEEEDALKSTISPKDILARRKFEVLDALNSPGDFNDGLIGFETAPGVGAIHSGKMEENEYEGMCEEDDIKQETEGESNSDKPLNEMMDEIDDEDMDDDIGDGKQKPGRGKTPTTKNRKVYRCPENDCSFWATTASRFHVHIVGHYNLKPFECSECHYKSNWRWDVNKHIRLKTPKDPKHAVASTLLTHESGQRDYRKYDNYLVTMTLTHSPDSKAPDCSTSVKRTKGSTVSTPKSSPDIPKDSPTSGGSTKQKSSKYTKVPASSSSSTGSFPATSSDENGIIMKNNNDEYLLKDHEEESHSFPVDSAPTPTSSNDAPARSFVETRMLAGGEIYQTSLLKQDLGLSTSSKEVVVSASESNKPEVDDKHPKGFDLTSKQTARSRHAPQQKQQTDEREVKIHDAMLLQQSHIDMQNQSAPLPLIPTKKARLHQQQESNQTTGLSTSSATGGQGNKVLSFLSCWQCIKCDFKHMNKDLVSTHIREQHKPKKGDPLSLLTNNHLIQVSIPEQDADLLMASSAVSTSDEMEFSLSGRGRLTPAQKKEIPRQEIYDEIGKLLSCKFCPFTTGLLYEMEIHAEHHLTTPINYFSCPHCSYSVAVKSELHEHVKLHGIISPVQALDVQISSSSLISSTTDRLMESPIGTTENLCKKDCKKLQCPLCPFVAADSNDYEYHKQCHEPNDYPFKCHQCSFNVSMKHLLLQHLRLHGIQIDEVGTLPMMAAQQPPVPASKSLLDCEYENISDPGTQDEPLDLSIFADRKPVVIWDGSGIPVEGYKCSVCPAVFQDLHDLKEHEYSNEHQRQAISTSVESSGRQCDSPCEVLNLSVKPEETPKKSSQSNFKVSNGKRSVTSSSSLLLPPLNGPSSSAAAPLSSPSSSSSLNSVDGASSTSSTSKLEKEFLYLCDECPARFFFEKELKIHHTFHENKSTFHCPKCTYSARQKDPHLMSHMRVHSTAYKEKTKALLLKYPRGKVNLTSNSPSNVIPSSTSSTTSSSAAAAAAAALSAASLLNLNQAGLLNTNFNLQIAAAALSKLNPDNGGAFSPDLMGLDGLRKNGLSIVCPKCPEKFYSPQTFQKHFELHSCGRVPSSEHRCRYCDYCAESKKALLAHEMVHTGSDISIEPTKFLAPAAASAFNPVSMMAMVAQDSPFSAVNAVNLASMCSGLPPLTQSPPARSPDTSPDKNSSAPVPEDAYDGNPDFIYPTYTKNGRIKSKRYKCAKCPSAFEKKDQYHTHIGLHGSNQKYKCTVCDYAVTYYANFIQHLKKHENQRNIPNDIMQIGRKRHLDEDGNGSLLKASKMSDNGENSRSSSVSSNVSSIDSHENQIGGVGMIPNLTKCSICPFNAFDQATLQAHLLHHQDNPNWLHICDICNFRTSSKKSLKEHSKLHNFQNYPGGNAKNGLLFGGNAKGQYLNGFRGENGSSEGKALPEEEGNEESSNASV